MPAEPRQPFDQVVVASGHMVDVPGRSPARFPASAEEAVADALEDTLRAWAVGPATLVLTGGARGADIVAAEVALTLGAQVWLLLPLPEERFVAESVDLPGSGWRHRFTALRQRCHALDQAGELGPPGAGEDVFERNNDWMLALGRAHAPAGRLRVVVVWDGLAGDGPGGTAHLVRQARAAGTEVTVVLPDQGSL